MHFYSSFEVIGKAGLQPDKGHAEVKNAPMLFNASPNFARGICNRSAHILQMLRYTWTPTEIENAVIDTRVHMLMPGFSPCIPGWHHDDVDRPNGGQPLYDNKTIFKLSARKHVLCVLNADIAATEFIGGGCELPVIPEGAGNTYHYWDEMVNSYLTAGKLDKIAVKSDNLYEFNSLTLHRGVPAVKSGWRWFFRASTNTNRIPTNEIRQQVQVYLPVTNIGW